MRAIARRLSEQHPDTNRDLGAVVVPMRDQVLGDTRIQVIALMTAAAAIVLIACANLASLLLARASVRRGEYAVRLSLGATRGRLARQVLVEALCLSAAGGVLGLAIPVLTTTFVERIVPVGLQAFTVSLMDWRLLAFAGALSIATGLLFSLGPALQSAHASTADVLQQHARGNAGGRSRAFRDGLVVLQVAATLVLLVAAGLMLRTLANLNAIELGFDANNLLTMQVPLHAEVRGPDQTAARFTSASSPASAHCQVCAGPHSARRFHFSPPATREFFSVEGRQLLPGDVPDALFRVGTADYLQTLRRDADRGAPARCARRRRRASRYRRQRNARPPIHGRTIGARPANPVRPDRAAVHRRRRREGRPRAWLPSRTRSPVSTCRSRRGRASFRP